MCECGKTWRERFLILLLVGYAPSQQLRASGTQWQMSVASRKHWIEKLEKSYNLFWNWEQIIKYYFIASFPSAKVKRKRRRRLYGDTTTSLKKIKWNKSNIMMSLKTSRRVRNINCENVWNWNGFVQRGNVK